MAQSGPSTDGEELHVNLTLKSEKKGSRKMLQYLQKRQLSFMLTWFNVAIANLKIDKLTETFSRIPRDMVWFEFL